MLKGNAVDADPAKIEELVLYGQQRLTSLWNVLRGRASRKFYIEVEDLNKRNMEVKQITSYLDKAGPGRTLCDPTIAFNKNFVPLGILYEEEGGESVEEDGADEPGKIWNWCEKACQDGGSATRRIEKAVNRLRNRLPYERKRVSSPRWASGCSSLRVSA